MIGISPQPVLISGGILLVFYFLYTSKNNGSNSFGSIAKESENVPDIEFQDIGGQKNAVTEVKEALEFLKSKEQADELGIRPIKGLLLSGPPGNGKTLIAKAASKYTDSVFISTSGSEFIEMYAGVGAKRVRKLFKEARKKASRTNKSSAVIFIDELDVLGAKRGSHGSHMEYDQTLNQLLVEMDGLDTETNGIDILIMGATNRVDSLDQALLRPGRFDRIVNVELPDKDGRYEILKLHAQNKPLDEKVDLETVASESFGFSGAHLESLVNETAILALRRNKSKLEKIDFSDAIEKIILGEELPRKPSKRELERIAIHELGHGFVMELLEPGSVAKIAISNRGKSLGYTRRSPSGEQYLKTKSGLENELCFLLAGSKFEEHFLSDRSTGNRDDFNKAFQVADEMIKSGMSSLGIVNYEKLPPDEINNTINQIISHREEQIEKVIDEYEPLIREIKKLLVERELITGEELREFLKGAA